MQPLMNLHNATTLTQAAHRDAARLSSSSRKTMQPLRRSDWRKTSLRRRSLSPYHLLATASMGTYTSGTAAWLAITLECTHNEGHGINSASISSIGTQTPRYASSIIMSFVITLDNHEKLFLTEFCMSVDHLRLQAWVHA